MTDKEKGLLLELLLLDIRGNWGWSLGRRVDAAYDLAKELKLEKTKDLIARFEHDDGRHFRCPYEECGGYEGMVVIHGLPHKLEGRSEEFKELALDLLTYPDCRFDDYEDDQ